MDPATMDKLPEDVIEKLFIQLDEQNTVEAFQGIKNYSVVYNAVFKRLINTPNLPNYNIFLQYVKARGGLNNEWSRNWEWGREFSTVPAVWEAYLEMLRASAAVYAVVQASRGNYQTLGRPLSLDELIAQDNHVYELRALEDGTKSGPLYDILTASTRIFPPLVVHFWHLMLNALNQWSYKYDSDLDPDKLEQDMWKEMWEVFRFASQAYTNFCCALVRAPEVRRGLFARMHGELWVQFDEYSAENAEDIGLDRPEFEEDAEFCPPTP
jgi:hypothetical protein